jgi:hypothetical protein
MFWRNFPGGSGTFCQDLLTDPGKRTRLRFKGLLSPLGGTSCQPAWFAAES